MRDDREPGRGGAGVEIFLVAALFLFPLLYFLSSGPAAALKTRGYLSQEAVNVIYYPLVVAAARSDWIANPLEWYIQLWVP
jgi:hypothetical protein